MPGFLPSLPSFDRILSGFHCRELLKPCSALINLLGVAGTPPRIFGTIAVRNLPQGWPVSMPTCANKSENVSSFVGRLFLSDNRGACCG